MTKYRFTKALNQELYNHYKTDALNGKREILLPLCLDKDNVVKIGAGMNIGDALHVKNLPTYKGCEQSEWIGDIHTHKYTEFFDTEFFDEVSMLSESDLFGTISSYFCGYVKLGDSIVKCLLEPTKRSDNYERYELLCEKYTDVTEEDIIETRRNAHPDYNKAAHTAEENLAKSILSKYPYGEKLPESVIMGLKKDVVKKVFEKLDIQGDYSTYTVYPHPDVQDSTDVDVWITRKELRGNIDRYKYKQWRKADATAIKRALIDKGKLKMGGFSITCKKISLGRKIKSHIMCDFKDVDLEL